MSTPIPASRPHASLSKVMFEAAGAWESCHPDTTIPEFFVLAIRGYYRDSMGKAGANDVGQYDDAIFIVSPLGFSSWNANVDPSRYGWNPNADKYMARLKLGCWRYQKVTHRGSYQAFGQSGNPVVVERIKQDGSVAMSERGCFGINLHRGGINGTSSEGCLTIPAEQWETFRSSLNRTMDIHHAQTFDLILIEGPIT